MRNYLTLIVWAALLTLLVSCSSIINKPTPVVIGGFPTPTQHPAFVSSRDGDIGTNTPRPIPTSVIVPVSPTENATQSPAQDSFYDINIYTDNLDPDWVILEDGGIEADTANSDIVRSGRRSIALTPLYGWGIAFFAVDENANQVYLRDEVVEISFWLNGGDGIIELDDLLITVVGSNNTPYWVDGDDSVVSISDDRPLFPGTRLSFLGLNHAVPPQTWVEVRIRLNSLIYEPDYKYVTGFYIKNDEEFLQTVFVDDVKIEIRSE